MHLKQVKIDAEHIFGELDPALVICQSLLQQNKHKKTLSESAHQGQPCSALSFYFSNLTHGETDRLTGLDV